ncbi:hypothetical protein [Sphingobacterium alkalisoli]|nr:hypothetical protein [Sphingobacterium alkalisoli]
MEGSVSNENERPRHFLLPENRFGASAILDKQTSLTSEYRILFIRAHG